jgi:hypothetical protein
MDSIHHLGRAHVARGGVLVLGGGFAGSHVARELGNSGATIVNPGPLRMVCPCVELVVGFAVELHADRRLVGVESEAGAF